VHGKEGETEERLSVIQWRVARSVHRRREGGRGVLGGKARTVTRKREEKRERNEEGDWKRERERERKRRGQRTKGTWKSNRAHTKNIAERSPSETTNKQRECRKGQKENLAREQSQQIKIQETIR
jgi:hypothetical protein